MQNAEIPPCGASRRLRLATMLGIAMVMLACLPGHLAAQTVAGVLVDDPSTPVDSIWVVAPLPDHNVISIGIDAATSCYRITVNGLTAEVPEVEPDGPIVQINCYGSAGGYDQVMVDGAGSVVLTLFWGNNTVTTSNHAVVTAYLFGDSTNVSAGSGSQVTYDTWGGTDDSFSGNCVRNHPDASYQATALPGVFITFPEILNIVSPVAQGNVLTVANDTATQTVTVTENGTTLTIPSAIIGFNYYGSWNGADVVAGPGAQNLFLYGSNNQVTLDASDAEIVLQGSGNTITDPNGHGQVWVHGTGETITGMTINDAGPAPVVPQVYSSGSGAPPTVATPAAASPSPVVTGTTTTLSVLGADPGGEADLTYTWAVTSGQGATFSVNGTNAAKTTVATCTVPGSYTFQVTIRNPSNLTATSSVTVVVGLSAIVLAPQTASVEAGATLQFTATGEGSTGQPLGVQPTFRWTVSGGGTISAAGLFTAGTDAGGPFTVTASAAGETATTTLTVTASTHSGTSTATSTGTGTTAGPTAGGSTASGAGSSGGSGGGCGLGGGLGALVVAALASLGSRRRRHRGEVVRPRRDLRIRPPRPVVPTEI